MEWGGGGWGLVLNQHVWDGQGLKDPCFSGNVWDKQGLKDPCFLETFSRITKRGKNRIHLKRTS